MKASTKPHPKPVISQKISVLDTVRYSNQVEYCTIISSCETASTNPAAIFYKRECNITHLPRDFVSPNPLEILVADKLEPLFRVPLDCI
jgi:hypothetical protein